MMRIVTLIVLIWLIVGAVAAGQRGYYSSSPTNCAASGPSRSRSSRVR